MRQRTIGLLVEGHGEMAAMPILVRRIAEAFSPEVPLRLPPSAWRVPKHKMLQSDAEILKPINVFAQAITRSGGGILVVWDADDDCPASEGPRQQKRIQALRPDVRIRVVIANREFESWFLAAAASLSAANHLLPGVIDHPLPESLRDAKGWITANRPAGRPYREIEHQHQFSKSLDPNYVRQRSPSFDKLCREIASLLEET